MSASIAGRTTILRAFCRAATTTTPRISRTTCLPSIRFNSTPRCPTSRLLRRELSSLQPLHSSIAAACLVSKLPNLAASSSEGGAIDSSTTTLLADIEPLTGWKTIVSSTIGGYLIGFESSRLPCLLLLLEQDESFSQIPGGPEAIPEGQSLVIIVEGCA